MWFGWCACGWRFGWTGCLLGCGSCAWLICSLVLWWCLRVWFWFGCAVVGLVDWLLLPFLGYLVARFWFACLVWAFWVSALGLIGTCLTLSVLLFGDLLVCDSGLSFGG